MSSLTLWNMSCVLAMLFTDSFLHSSCYNHEAWTNLSIPTSCHNLDCWFLCNKDLHSPQQQPVLQDSLFNQVQHLIYQMQSHPILQDIAPSLTIEEILHRAQLAIHEWLQNSASCMQQYIAAAHQRAQLKTQDICKFLIRKSQSKLAP